VTVSFACEFLDAAREGELVEGSGEIMRAGGSMIFLRGVLKSAERPLFTFSGTIKRVKRRMPVLPRLPPVQADNCFSAIESHSAWAWRRYLGARLI
jgi:hypothetical protein